MIVWENNGTFLSKEDGFTFEETTSSLTKAEQENFLQQPAVPYYVLQLVKRSAVINLGDNLEKVAHDRIFLDLAQEDLHKFPFMQEQ